MLLREGPGPRPQHRQSLRASICYMYLYLALSSNGFPYLFHVLRVGKAMTKDVGPCASQRSKNGESNPRC